jgi:hypothetical protein
LEHNYNRKEFIVEITTPEDLTLVLVPSGVKNFNFKLIQDSSAATYDFILHYLQTIIITITD